MKLKLVVIIFFVIFFLFRYADVFQLGDGDKEFQLNIDVHRPLTYGVINENTEQYRLWGMEKKDKEPVDVEQNSLESIYQLISEKGKFKIQSSTDSHDFWQFTGAYMTGNRKKAMFYNPSLPEGKNLLQVGEGDVMFDQFIISKITASGAVIRTEESDQPVIIKVLNYERTNNEKKDE